MSRLPNAMLSANRIRRKPRYVLPLLAAVMAPLAIAQTSLKLQCSINEQSTFSTGKTESRSFTAIIEVEEYPNGALFIIPSGDEFHAASTRVTGNVIQARNYSNANKWELDLEIRDREFPSLINKYRTVIDRNQGAIYYSSNFRDSRMTTDGRGSCEKIDQSRRKF